LARGRRRGREIRSRHKRGSLAAIFTGTRDNFIKGMADKIINKGNWFLVEVIERCEPVNSDNKKDLRRCTVWGNFHLIKASTPDKAYDKAVQLGLSGNYTFKNSDKLDMKWEFVGIGDILPIYEDLEDKAEVMWTDYGFISAKRSEKLTRTKKELLKNLKLKK
jgi:hypothetical protein